jgi:hypothetical protein
MWPSRAFVAGRSESGEAGSKTHRMGNANVISSEPDTRSKE